MRVSKPHTDSHVLEVTDLTPIRGATADQDLWLRELARDVDTAALSLKLSGGPSEYPDPIVYFDEGSACWWAGRYVGEVQFKGRTLRIMPRFGMPQLQRWLCRIWRVHLVPMSGEYQTTRIWLWVLLAKLWESRLLVASKHGLPYVRADEVHVGRAIRGRLHVGLTGKELSLGTRNLVSRTRTRQIDGLIGGLLLAAFTQLRKELLNLGASRNWLTDRAENIITQLQSSIEATEVARASLGDVPIKYTPMTENYRGVVDLSRAIFKRRPIAAGAEGQSKVLGVLIDMAEVWELYVYHLLRSELRDLDVIHSGRAPEPVKHLARSNRTGESLAGLKPDILVRNPSTNRLVAVLDAKYKTTTVSQDRPRGILREDLYQITAYMSALCARAETLDGGLVYPARGDSDSILALRDKNPWRVAGRRLWLHGINYNENHCTSLETSDEERNFVATIQNAFLGDLALN